MKTLKSFTFSLVVLAFLGQLMTGVCVAPAHASETTPKYGGTMTFVTHPSRPLIGWPPDLMMNNVVYFVQACLETLLRADEEGKVYPWLSLGRVRT